LSKYNLPKYIFLSVRRQKSGSLGFAKGRLAGGVKPNVPFAGWLKLLACLFSFLLSGACECLAFVFKNVRWDKQKT